MYSENLLENDHQGVWEGRKEGEKTADILVLEGTFMSLSIPNLGTL